MKKKNVSPKISQFQVSYFSNLIVSNFLYAELEMGRCTTWARCVKSVTMQTVIRYFTRNTGFDIFPPEFGAYIDFHG